MKVIIVSLIVGAKDKKVLWICVGLHGYLIQISCQCSAKAVVGWLDMM